MFFITRTLTFQNQNVELWDEINELTTALRSPENEITPDQEFYVKSKYIGIPKVY